MDATHKNDDEAKLSPPTASAAAGGGGVMSSAAVGAGAVTGSNSNMRDDTLHRLLELVQAGDDQHDALRAGLEALSTEERTAMWTARVPNKIVFNVCVFLDLP